jgi:crossover junction endodeoxyribonuclease RuvC
VSHRYPRHILAVDPGTDLAGWCRLEVPAPGTWSVRGLGTIVFPPGKPLYRRLAFFQERLEPIVAEAKQVFAECVCERPFVNKNHMATLAIAGARAIALALFGRANLRFSEYGPSQWKMVTGNGRADKPEIAYKVRALLKHPHELQFDQADAAGLALFHVTRPENLDDIDA